MDKWRNFIGSQLLWLAAVAGAARGLAWLGPVVFAAFALMQLWPSNRARGDVMLMLIALPVGLLVDTGLAASGMLRYASPISGSSLSPPWILALWMGFALTFNHSLAYLMARTRWAVLMGATAGPFSYWVASRSWGAVHFTDSMPRVLITLAALWGAAMGVFSLIVARMDTSLPPAGPLQ